MPSWYVDQTVFVSMRIRGWSENIAWEDMMMIREHDLTLSALINEDKRKIRLENIAWEDMMMIREHDLTLPPFLLSTHTASTHAHQKRLWQNHPWYDRDDDQYDNDDDLAKSTLRRSWCMCFGSLSVLRAWLLALPWGRKYLQITFKVSLPSISHITIFCCWATRPVAGVCRRQTGVRPLVEEQFPKTNF